MGARRVERLIAVATVTGAHRRCMSTRSGRARSREEARSRPNAARRGASASSLGRVAAVVAVGAALLLGSSSLAHHSGALFYDPDGSISLTGVVNHFNFRNPHAIVELLVTLDDGEEQRWTAETAAPSALRRRGWNQDSLQAGETVTLDGFRARDGSRLMRITRVTRDDGTEVGVPRGWDE